jgi:hypothetical protein
MDRAHASHGERLGVSSSYMARVCTDLRVPWPPRGYWAQREVGKAPERPALPPARPGDVTEWRRGSALTSTLPQVVRPAAEVVPNGKVHPESPKRRYA